MKVDSIHVRVDEPRNDVTRIEEEEELLMIMTNTSEFVGWGTSLYTSGK